MKYIKLINTNRCALVDDGDYDYLRQFTWYLWNHNGSSYATGIVDKKYLKMQELLISHPPDTILDHKNRNGLDNQKGNLRVATYTQNQINQKIRIDNTSGYKGVSFDKVNKLWVAQISIKGKIKKLGRYSTKELTACAYNKKAKEIHGEFAVLNVIGDVLSLQ